MLDYKVKTTSRGHRQKTFNSSDRAFIYVYIETDLKEKTIDYCKKNNISMSNYIRDLINKDLSKC